MRITKEVWYYPKKDEVICAYHVGKNQWLMFKTETKYYYYTVSKKTVKANGMIFLGVL